MFIRPLCFDFENDRPALEIQDQLFVGEGIMIAPVCRQNENGRMVYFPEPMIQVTWKDGKTKCKKIKAGDSYIEMPLDSVVFFVRKGKIVPLFEPVMNTSQMKNNKYDLVGKGKSYELYEDDGFTSDIHLEGRIRILR
jgi:alpha-glucosidase